MNKSLKDFLIEELKLEEINLDFKKELICFYLKNIPENNLNKKHLQDLVFLATGFISEKENRKKIDLLYKSFNDIPDEIKNSFEKKSLEVLWRKEFFVKHYSFSISTKSVSRVEERTKDNLAGVSSKAGRGIWSDKDGAYTKLSPEIIGYLKNYINDKNLINLKTNLTKIIFEKNTTISPIVSLLHVIEPNEFLLINGFINKGLKKIYKKIKNEKLPLEINKDIKVYFDVCLVLKQHISLNKDFKSVPFFMVIDHYLALIKDNYTVDLMGDILIN